MEKLAELEKTLGVSFQDKDLLQTALTHRSYLNENPSWHLPQNERLEFLGDAVLELAVTRYLYLNYENQEGELTSYRAALVNSIMLADVAATLKFGDFLLLSRGEAKDEGKARMYILANTFEAIVGAIYLDQGYDVAAGFIERALLTRMKEVLDKKLYRDAKSYFQEKAQEITGVTPTYEVLKEWGPDHAKNFVVGVYISEELIAEGQGSSKQEAQQDAAEKGLAAKKWE
ncbi:MAG: ribonuclease III [Candidatus Ryanbacteria bacterium RIFCSPHIGHO2_02_FULL_45_17b]|uniref:Ribonuclease 3 n=1 Tax=Candidatus Ryanbacteria bacterium RIFCSPHIGHO2_01_FULL_45_22 TaxID=1802114 RepID=A0A1G2G2V1_9BACT|nr:MAG: ribonuclease III [Candidatus Ryanbacteria bacterium RIFCSPHIGHO2_01_FULL_45_22]OGZ47628.1 MAG: ribonuclease III [Candidatus Ryanbacteria bacterium RIFCSPHIGHO2_02_FULL_45_17b]